MTQGTFDIPQSPHAHLKLHRQVPSGPRVRRRAGFGGEVRYPDQPAHAKRLRRDLSQLRAIYAKRTNVLGVAPENVAVLTFTAPPNPERIQGAGLTVLEWFPDRVVVTAPGDPEMTALVNRLDEYQTGPRSAPVPDGPASAELEPSGEGATEQRVRTAPHQQLFDAIDQIRPLSADEILTPDAAAAIEAAGATDALTLDLQCWCPEDPDDARRRNARTVSAVEQGGGRVLDQTVRHRSGLSLIRVDVSAELARTITNLPDVRRIDRIPRPLISQLETMSAGADLLPVAQEPAPNAPLVAVIDSGVRSSHPLIAPAFVAAIGAEGLEAERDGSGHGTFVASLALYGSLEPLLQRRTQAVAPAARLMSVRVLADNNEFLEADLWENDLMWALEAAAAEGARIINISIGDPRRPYSPARPTPLAATVDEFVRRSGAVVVISTGNMSLDAHEMGDDYDFTSRLLDSDDTGMLDPATSALALTVGALGGDEGQGARRATSNIDLRPLGRPDVPSPMTRTGPGAGRMIKPEAALPGGHLVYTDTDRFPRPSPTTSVVGAHGTDPNRVLALDVGTSFAAPLLTHIAARAMGANPDLSGRGIRALVLASVRPLPPYLDPVSAATIERQRRLTGYGRPDAERAAYSTDHRAVLVAEESLRVDNVHLYVVPIPPSFFETGGWRRITVSLAFDPDTRPTRLDYLGSRMQVHVYKGADTDTVADAYLAERQRPTVSGPRPDSADGSDDAKVEVPAVLERFRENLQPAPTYRSRGAHLFGTFDRQHRLKAEEGTEYVIAVQNVNRWSLTEASEDYALCVVLEREQGRTPIYADLRAALQVEIPVEVEAEIGG